MITCLCDAFFADVAQASVEILEFLGCEIEFPEDQTCCGQPAFNNGDWDSARGVIRHAGSVFRGDLPVVLPSGSCCAMLRHGNLLCFENEPDLPAMQALAGRAWEISEYIVHGLGVDRWPGRLPARVALHHACHTRGSQIGEASTRLLSSIDGLELVPCGEAEQCCGFGGTFAVTFPHLSSAIGQLKIEHLLEHSPTYVASSDMSCLMHQKGLADKSGRAFAARHTAQLLRDALREGGLIA